MVPIFWHTCRSWGDLSNLYLPWLSCFEVGSTWTARSLLKMCHYVSESEPIRVWFRVFNLDLSIGNSDQWDLVSLLLIWISKPNHFQPKPHHFQPELHLDLPADLCDVIDKLSLFLLTSECTYVLLSWFINRAWWYVVQQITIYLLWLKLLYKNIKLH